MIAAGVFLGICLLVGIVYAISHAFEQAARRKTQATVEREMNKIVDEHNRKVVHLKDPDRPVDPKEVQDALTRVRDLGRKPE